MHLVMLDAGGTISAVDRGRGFDGGALGDDILAHLAEVAPWATIEARSVYRGLSEAMTFGDAMSVAQAVRGACLDPAVDAVLVAHGTDAMEETAFLCDLIVPASKPVIFTGSQRAPSEPGYDGLRNLADAVLTAARRGAAASGVLVVFGGCVLSATRARKVHAQALQAFGPDAAVVGRCGAASPLAARRPRPALPVSDAPAAAVEIVTLGLGSDGRLVTAAASRLEGMVIQGLGCGNASPGVIQAVEKAVEAGRLVGVVAGCFEGEAAPVYASGRRLSDIGAIFMKDMDARRARMLIACALGDRRTTSEASALILDWLKDR